MWSGMVGAPSGLVQRHRRRPPMGLGFRRVAAAASSRGACGAHRPEPCMGATRNPRPTRRARCRGSRPGLAGRAARGARPPPRWPGQRARGWGSRPPPCRPPDSTPGCHRVGSALKKCLKFDKELNKEVAIEAVDLEEA
ncbi:hypothetical protein BDA96_05G050700 [Sorghum bicolor]|uniref:Uncharacterized protein n=1 Tax=Sorghum bicolor TaxID=4558 RepID=A0A921UFC1_SORBI|nr:hypothetical protein BDA96_05G050700 [Sorghum bicolor]